MLIAYTTICSVGLANHTRIVLGAIVFPMRYITSGLRLQQTYIKVNICKYSRMTACYAKYMLHPPRPVMCLNGVTFIHDRQHHFPCFAEMYTELLIIQSLKVVIINSVKICNYGTTTYRRLREIGCIARINPLTATAVARFFPQDHWGYCGS